MLSLDPIIRIAETNPQAAMVAAVAALIMGFAMILAAMSKWMGAAPKSNGAPKPCAADSKVQDLAHEIREMRKDQDSQTKTLREIRDIMRDSYNEMRRQNGSGPRT